ncbi:MAG: hypothetical protein IPQ14_02360 [Candidatus Microthrix sp.]|jgi:hypothetical protein|nr:hypothetical protein [Candidatus Microthrix sp.]MBL0203184.1 hypothetical protein [Candidatus Microthrix sp.]
MSRTGGASRSIPGWAADLIAVLSRDRPAVVTRQDLAGRLEELGVGRDLERTARDLQQLGWFASLHLKGVWAFVPAGEANVTDPYIDLRAWKAREPDAAFALAGEAAAWHLGYLPRNFGGTIAVWLPPNERVPHGLRSYVSLVRLSWAGEQASEFVPNSRLLRRKGLDLTNWAAGLPAFGPEALVVQLGARPASFRVWADLVPQLDVLASDCDTDKIERLLGGQSASAWQRAAYLLHRGGRSDDAVDLLDRRPSRSMPVASFGDGATAAWSSRFSVNDHLIAPLQDQLGKA